MCISEAVITERCSSCSASFTRAYDCIFLRTEMIFNLF